MSSKADYYRARAAECEEKAEAAMNIHAKEMFKEVARHWRMDGRHVPRSRWSGSTPRHYNSAPTPWCRGLSNKKPRPGAGAELYWRCRSHPGGAPRDGVEFARKAKASSASRSGFLSPWLPVSMMRLASNSRVEAARKSAARTLPETFSICHAVSKAAVKIFVAAGSKKPLLLRSGVIGMVAPLPRRERNWSLGHRLPLHCSFLPMVKAVWAYLGRMARLFFARPRCLRQDLVNGPRRAALGP